MNRLTTRSNIRLLPGLSILNICKYCTGHIIASYFFQSIIGLANLLSAISCYKFCTLKDQQENIKFTFTFHFAAFLFAYVYIYSH